MRRLLSLTGGLALLALTGLALAPIANAQVVYDNGSFVGADNSRNISRFAAADDFTVASSLTFSAIRFYALDFTPSLLDDFGGTLNWEIHTSSGVTPNAIPSGTIVASGTTSLVSVTDTGQLVDGRQVAQMDFATPSTTLSAGTYWLRIDEGEPASAYDGDPILWLQTGGPITGNGYRGDDDEVAPTTWFFAGTNTTRDLSFQLLNNQANAAAPEPGTFALLGVGMGMVGVVARRKRQA
jgi:hypothetical protein